MAKRKNILLTEEQSALAKKAKQRTEIMKDIRKKREIEMQGKGYLDFADEVVAGLYYGYESGELTQKELCKRIGISVGTSRADLHELLIKHPRWAMLSKYGVQTVSFGSTVINLPIGQMTDDKSLYSILRFNIARLMASEYPSDYSMGCKLLLNAYNMGVIDKVEKEEIVRNWTHVVQDGEKENQTFYSNQIAEND